MAGQRTLPTSELESRYGVTITKKLEVLIVPEGSWWNNGDGTWRFEGRERRMSIRSQTYNDQGEPWENDEGVTLTKQQLCELAFQAAGAASVPFMEDHPHYVMPSERMSAGVVEVLRSFGVDPAKVRGYAGAVEASAEFEQARRVEPVTITSEEEVGTPEARGE